MGLLAKWTITGQARCGPKQEEREKNFFFGIVKSRCIDGIGHLEGV
jgi:hypothetical protein